MKIAVTHLTRMSAGSVCVAGLDLATGRHVRPVFQHRPLHALETARHGGPFDLATVVDLGDTTPAPAPPAVEDHRFVGWRARALEAIEPDRFWELLTGVAGPTLHALFGPELTVFGRRGQRHGATALGRGRASLGVLKPRIQPMLRLDRRPDGRMAVRMTVWDDGQTLDLSVTDLRLYEDDGVTPNVRMVRQATARLAQGEGVLLGVGLTRAHATRDGEAPRHWLQVNNIHLERSPCSRLAARAPSGGGAAPQVAVPEPGPVPPARAATRRLTIATASPRVLLGAPVGNAADASRTPVTEYHWRVARQS